MTKKEHFFLVSMIILFLFPIILDYWVAQFRPVFLIRYLLFSSIGFFVLFAFTVFNMSYSINLKILFSLALLSYYAYCLRLNPEKNEDWKNAITKYKELRNKDDLTILSVSYADNAFSFYFDRNIFKNYNKKDSLLLNENIHLFTVLNDSLFMKLKRTANVITIQSHQGDEDPNNTVFKTINKFYENYNEYNFKGIEIKVFTQR